MAVTTISNQIRAGQIEVGLAVGIESMTAQCVYILASLGRFVTLTLRCSPDQGPAPGSCEIAAHKAASDARHFVWEDRLDRLSRITERLVESGVERAAEPLGEWATRLVEQLLDTLETELAQPLNDPGLEPQ